MSIKTYYMHLRCNNEKTYDSCIALSRLNAAKYFANKKQIPLKKWLKIYFIPKN